MKGQWFGRYDGTSSGFIVTNVDEMKHHYEGEVSLYEDNPDLPSVAVFFRTKNKRNPFHFSTKAIFPIDKVSNTITNWEKIKAHYPKEVTLSKSAIVEGSWDNEKLSLKWKTNINVVGNCELPRSKAGEPSELVAKSLNWNKYKSHVAKLGDRYYIFRGQNQPWRLRTSFHRTGRAQLQKYLLSDIPNLLRHLSARTKHVFNLQDPNEYGAFLNLIQHYGYPTPILDWTYSPYVAAFFAYRGISSTKAAEASPEEKVRIHIFDQARWITNFRQYNTLSNTELHVSIREFLAIENERMIPQQATSTITSIDDIEGYVKGMEKMPPQNRFKKNYLTAIDIPVKERDKVMHELRYMGITAGSMFPGVDGTCEELKEQNFRI